MKMEEIIAILKTKKGYLEENLEVAKQIGVHLRETERQYKAFTEAINVLTEHQQRNRILARKIKGYCANDLFAVIEMLQEKGITPDELSVAVRFLNKVTADEKESQS